MQFDVYAYPCQTTSDPDPVQAMNRFVRQNCPGALILGEDKLPDMYRPRDERPAFYFRLRTLEQEKAIYSVTWMLARLNGHIICPGAAARLRWLKALMEELTVRGEVEMLDGSPLEVLKGARADSEANCMTSGQLQLPMRYGVLRKKAKAHGFKHISAKGGD